jgi:hypothetical protein
MWLSFVSKGTTPGAGVARYTEWDAVSTDGGSTWTVSALGSVSSDVDGTSPVSLQIQDPGAYSGLIVSRFGGKDTAYAIWTHAPHTAPCSLVDQYRAAINNGQAPPEPDPDAGGQCPVAFGRTDILSAVIPL